MEKTSKIKRARTVSETVEYNNSHDPERKIDISASVNVESGHINHINSGVVYERGTETEDGKTGLVANFGAPNKEQLDTHIYRRVEGMTRAEIVAAIDDFIDDLRAEIENA